MLNFSELVSEYETPAGLQKMLDSLDIITLNHSVRVCEIAKLVEYDLGYGDTSLSEAALYHDIGKYFITEKLLNKRGKLNKLEKFIINSHSYLSYKILQFFEINEDICLISLYHHSFEPTIIIEQDKDDMVITSYVAGRARALKTIDIYEALTTDRPYHRGVKSDDAINTIINTIPDCDMNVLESIRRHAVDLE